MNVYSADWVLPVEGDPIEDGAVAVENGRLAAVGTSDELGEGTRFDDAVIVPGFVNAHSHLGVRRVRRLRRRARVRPLDSPPHRAQGRIAWEEFVAIARLGAAECLRSGITTIADASFSGARHTWPGELGLRGIVCLELFGADLASSRRPRRSGAPSSGARSAWASHRTRRTPPRPTSTARPYRDGAAPVVTHVAESDDEVQYMLSGTGPIAAITEIPSPGMTPVRYLAREGLLRPTTLAAHCVKVDADEIALLAEHDVAVAHCPRSNAILGCGIAPP